jgi:tetratricopeptide (TPR) repeat protein
LSNAVPQTRFDELIEQGRALRERGDTSSALIRFREAQTLDPRNPLPIAEAARTYEAMAFYEKAAEQWKRIYDMGETAAGSYYIAADARLKQSQTLALMQAQQNSGAGTNDAAVSTTNAGATLGIGIISMEEEADADAERKFVLRAPLRAKPRARVEVRDVVIQVLFYDMVDNKDVVQTNANVNSRWASTPPDWSDGDTEVLEVEYAQAKVDATDAKREARKYFGYIVRLYYKDELQDSRAEPARLGAQFPAPTTLPQETTQ